MRDKSTSSRLNRIKLRISYVIDYRILRPYLNYIRRLNLEKVELELERLTNRDRSQISKSEIVDLIAIENPVIFEVGANIGTDTLEFAMAFPKGEIHAFEPLPMHLHKLYSFVTGYENVRIIPCALSDQVGFAKFYQSSGYSGGSGSLLIPTLHLERDKNTFFLESDQCFVLTQTLAEYVKTVGVSKVDFLWMDAQGAELKILKGLGDFVKKIRFIYSEVSTVPFYEESCVESDLESFLANVGFSIIRNYRGASEESGNVLWENNSFTP